MADCDKEVEEKLKPHGFNVQRLIGTGAFGEVFLTESKFSKQKYAVKVAKCPPSVELDYWDQLKNENIAPLLQTINLQYGRFAFVMPLYDWDLYELLRNEKFQSDMNCFEKKRKFTSDILRGLQYLHSNYFVHQDIKEKNIFVDINSNKAVIGDFSCMTKMKYSPTRVDTTAQVAFEHEMWNFGILVLRIFTTPDAYKNISSHDFHKSNGTKTRSFLSWINKEASEMLTKCHPHIAITAADAEKFLNFLCLFITADWDEKYDHHMHPFVLEASMNYKRKN